MKATTVQCENYKWQNLRMEQGEDKLKTFDNDDAKQVSVDPQLEKC